MRWFVILGLVVALTLAGARPALAHGSAALGEFYTGMLLPVLHFEALLSLLALALWATQLGDRLIWQVPVTCLAAMTLAAIAGLLGVSVPGFAQAGSVVMLATGLLVVTELRPCAAPALVFAALVGAWHGGMGVAGEEAAAKRPILYFLGLFIGSGLLLFHVENIAFRARAFWMKIGIRVLGSWITAIGLLMTMLSLLGTKLPSR